MKILRKANAIYAKYPIHLVFLLIILVSVFMRTYMLDAKPMHHDEANLWYQYITKIVHNEKFFYFAPNHGYTPFYFTAIGAYFGESLFNLRIVDAIVGTLAIAALWLLRRYIGDRALLLTSGILAISPSFIYYSRFAAFPYPFMALFSVLGLYCVLEYFRTKMIRYIYLTFVLIAMAVTTHEITVVLIAIALSFFFALWLLNYEKFLEILKDAKKINRIHILLSIILFLLIVMAIMSSFFTNMENLSKLGLQSYGGRTNEGHNKELLYYEKVLAPLEMLSFIGLITFIFFINRSMLPIFIFYWAVAINCFISMMPYKIPWVYTFALLPMYLIFGISIDTLYAKIAGKRIWKNIVTAVLVLLFILTFARAIQVNYIDYDGKDAVNMLNYVGPVEDTYRLINAIKAMNCTNDTKVLFAMSGHWPMNYYLRNCYLEYYEYPPKDIDMSKFYGKYDYIIVNKDTHYSDYLVNFIGQYELRENFFVDILANKTNAKTIEIEDDGSDNDIQGQGSSAYEEDS